MRALDDLVAEAEAADVTGWGFEWLDGRATEERPPWGYARLLADRLASSRSALDIDTGGGEVLAEAPVLPPRMTVTESWAPNAERARQRLEPRGVRVVRSEADGPLPFPAGSFDLVTARHPVRPDWPEIARVLAPGGRYLAQHVGPGSAFELVEHFLGPQPDSRRDRHPDTEVAAAEAAGLRVVDLRTARCRMELFDVGAVVWLLRKCPWWVPGFSADEHRPALERLDELFRRGEPFVAHSTRHLVEAARRP
ncbi:methyltransferase family protein [Isoptericola sp. CG 20/1183]|uniref:Methyltransferase family protein n=1 Tax=Isoptericola halotolerans TaxID=300560 RepID=A0ABX5EEM8_9MICO|nr:MULTISPECIES: class I SAM-dependent methyltransferase [Isoptericola]PRZ07595.1 methyltransferase family protein [Isoptericola halotolerans]PRZ08046.1 methyltransferase family protein [Isoptericola sp. CG 20/1183]